MSIGIHMVNDDPMNLRAVDLNLLVALDALLREMHVTRAADSIGLSQPAMSNALARLRQVFKDELLVRSTSGMRPTARALELIVPTRDILRQIERVLDSDNSFSPKKSTRTFAVRMSDLLGLLILPGVLGRVRRSAPSIKFEIVHLSPLATVEALERDEVDVAVSMGLEPSRSIRSEVLFGDQMVCVMRKAHPLASKPLKVEEFLNEQHLKVSMSPTDLRFVDEALARRQLRRDVTVNVPHWLVVPSILARTNLLSVMPGRLAKAIGGKELAVRELPFASSRFDWAMYWHSRHEGNPALQWLRTQFVETCRAIA
jgi:DNA-binding transcriptional LysR family regulator